MNLRCAIVDDEPLALGLLESYVKKTAFLELCGKWSSAVQAMKYFSESQIDLLFLDIQMPDLNGLEFSKLVSESTRIVFTTAFEQYAIEGFRVNALDYLLKPISYSDFMGAVNKAVKWFELKNQPKEKDLTEVPYARQSQAKMDLLSLSQNFLDNQSGGKTNGESEDDAWIYVKSEYKIIQVELDKILYIEGLKDYVKIHLEDSQKPLLSLVSLRSMEEKLPTSKFIRVHRSFIVQKSKIKIIEKGRIVFGKEYIPVSESYKQELQNYVLEHSV